MRVPPRARPVAGTATGVGVVAVVVAALLPVHDDVTPASPALALVVPIVVAALVGGRLAALLVAVAAATAFNVVFIDPRWTLKVDAFDDGVALGVFTLVAAVVGTLVAREGARRQSAEDRAVELQALNDELLAVQRERERLAEEADRATVLQRVDEQRTALLRSVSHDLRTPLATIGAVVSDLLEGPPYDEATRAELLSLVADEVARLDRLVANLLDLSRIEAGALHPDVQAVAIDELVHDTTMRLGRLFAHRRLQVELPAGLPLVEGDYIQLRQVLSNLLENAARHAPLGTTVRITAREQGEAVQVSVDDEGAGVLPFDRARIFEPFRRGEGSGSSGVGLAICKAIVEAHGGHIEALPAPDGGARFRFSVPRRRD